MALQARELQLIDDYSGGLYHVVPHQRPAHVQLNCILQWTVSERILDFGTHAGNILSFHDGSVL